MLIELDSPFSVVNEDTSSEDIDVGIAMETAVAFPVVRVDVGIVASGDAVRGSLKMSQISAMAPKVAHGRSAGGRVRQVAGDCDRNVEKKLDKILRTRDTLPEAFERRKEGPTLLTLSSITRLVGARVEAVDVESAVAEARPVGRRATCAVHI